MSNIEKLKHYLSCESLPVKSEDYFNYFNEIAEILMNHCVITKRGINYEIVEIEFYLYSAKHQDVITYPRELSAGQWYFHPSGVDLTFESNTEHFGGILLRGIRNIDTGKLTLGPQKCVDLLWDTSDAFNVHDDDYPTIVEYPENFDTIIRVFPRWIPVNRKSEKEKGTTNAQIERITSIFSNAEKKSSDINLLPEIKDEYRLVSKSDLNSAMNLTYSQPYRFIKFDLIDSTPKGWSGYSAKPKI